MTPQKNITETAVFGGGCFWCTEAVFKMLKGVISVEPGYAGGSTPNPTYHSVTSGTSGHAEVVKIEFDPTQIIFHELLTVFFATHDATQVNRQGNDVGTQYRSIILYTNIAQKSVAESFIRTLDDSADEGDDIATEIQPLGTPPKGGFTMAEQEHLDFYAKNQNKGYCQIVIAPKLQKAQRQFAALIKKKKSS